jgi:hypothetical protein
MPLDIKDNITKSLRRIEMQLVQLPKEAFKEFVKDTPVRSGNARRRTRLSGNKIIAGYNYAQKLDEGFSKQAPKGMTTPTEEFVKQRVSAILKRK